MQIVEALATRSRSVYLRTDEGFTYRLSTRDFKLYLGSTDGEIVGLVKGIIVDVVKEFLKSGHPDLYHTEDHLQKFVEVNTPS